MVRCLIDFTIYFDSQILPLRRQDRRALHETVRRNLQPAESEQHGLQHAARTRHEIGIAAGGRFGKHPERRPQVGQVGATEHFAGFFGHSEPGILNRKARIR